MYTGDDFNYPELIRGDGTAQRRAARASSTRSRRPRRPRCTRSTTATSTRYDAMLAPTVPLARHIFARADVRTTRPASSSSPTSTATRSTSGWSAGWRARARSLHLAELFVLADQAGLLRDPELASARMRHVLRAGGDRA